MRFVGEWHRGEDGVVVPTVKSRFVTADGQLIHERFLIDSGADRTVLTAKLLDRLGVVPAAPADTLRGVGGSQAFVLVPAVFELRRDDGPWVTFRGVYAALLGPGVSEFSLLGRDVLDLFDVILSRQRNEIALLAGNHTYRIDPAA